MSGGPFIVRHVRAELIGLATDFDTGALDFDEEVERVLSVKAVETLELARDRIIECGPEEFPDARVFAKLAESIAAIGPKGGKVDLPDGSQVVVEERSWTDLIADLKGGSVKPQLEHRFSAVMKRALLAKWNAAFGVAAQSEGVR